MRSTERLRLDVTLIPGHQAKPLPALQDATFGSALMGRLDLLAPALLAAIVAGRGRTQLAAAAATTVAALLWGLLLSVTSPMPATVPVLAGLAAALLVSSPARAWYGRARRERAT